MTGIALRDDASAPRVHFLSLRGRLDRTRYIAQALGAIALAFALLLLASLALPLRTEFGRLLYTLLGVLLLYGFLPIRFAMLTVRRAHDFNAGGWLAVLLLIPILNLVFCLIPGTRGENAYGPPPSPASAATRVTAALLALLMTAGFLVGIEHAGQPAVAPPSTSLKPYTP